MSSGVAVKLLIRTAPRTPCGPVTMPTQIAREKPQEELPSPTQPCRLGPPSPAMRERVPSPARRVRGLPARFRVITAGYPQDAWFSPPAQLRPAAADAASSA